MLLRYPFSIIREILRFVRNHEVKTQPISLERPRDGAGSGTYVLRGLPAKAIFRSQPDCLAGYLSRAGNCLLFRCRRGTGFNSFYADFYGIKTVIGKAKGKNRPEWFGKADELIVKLIADEKGKVIGGQAIGVGAKERINIISTAIKAGFTLKDVADLELAYCPAVSDYYDVLVRAAELGLRKVK